MRHLQRHAAEVRHRSDATTRSTRAPIRRAAPFDLTGAAYSCTSADGQTKLAWDGTTLTIKGTVFIDGSAKSTSGAAKYVGKGTIILSGLYSMDNDNALCVNLSGQRLQHERAVGPRHDRPRDRR